MPSVLQAACPMIQLVLVYFCPESPRWLIAHNREDEVFEILTKYHAGGNRISELVKFEMAEIKAAIAKEQSGKKVPGLHGLKQKQIFIDYLSQLRYRLLYNCVDLHSYHTIFQSFLKI